MLTEATRELVLRDAEANESAPELARYILCRDIDRGHANVYECDISSKRRCLVSRNDILSDGFATVTNEANCKAERKQRRYELLWEHYSSGTLEHIYRARKSVIPEKQGTLIRPSYGVSKESQMRRSTAAFPVLVL